MKENLRRLFLLRIIVLSAQVLVIVVATKFISIALPVYLLSVVIAFHALLNVITWFRLRSTTPISEPELFIQMVADVMALTALLYFTGGSANPFAFLLLLPLTLVAAALPGVYTWVMAVTTIGCYTLLMVFQKPLVFSTEHQTGMFDLHVMGMWVGFMFSAGLVAYFVVNMGKNLRERDRLLALAREKALRDEQLVTLGTLAASTAHELGTPLGTIAIVSKELHNDYSHIKEVETRTGVLMKQVERCKAALSNLSVSAGALRAESGYRITLDRFINDLVKEWASRRPNVTLRINARNGTDNSPFIVAERVLFQAVSNVLDNAADASPDDVLLEFWWSERHCIISVCDRGDGFSPEVAKLAGKDVVSTKAAGEGLGLGLFLTNAVVEKFGGNMTINQRQSHGTQIIINLPFLQLADETR